MTGQGKLKTARYPKEGDFYTYTGRFNNNIRSGYGQLIKSDSEGNVLIEYEGLFEND